MRGLRRRSLAESGRTLMTTRLLTRADPEAAERLRLIISGARPAAEIKPTPKRKPKTPGATAQMVDQKVVVGPDEIIVQFPMYLDRSQYNAGGMRWTKADAAKSQKETVLTLLRAQLRALSECDEARAAISGFHITRLSPGEPDDDNVVSMCKHIRDALCGWIVFGDRPFNVRAIGHYDRQLKKRGVTWEHPTHEKSPAGHGIQIRLRTKCG